MISLVRKETCFIRSPGSNKCKNNVVALVKVKNFHPHSMRESSQTWKFCENHLKMFIQSNGVGWYRWYNKEGKKSYIIDFRILSSLNLFEMSNKFKKTLQSKKNLPSDKYLENPF